LEIFLSLEGSVGYGALMEVEVIRFEDFRAFRKPGRFYSGTFCRLEPTTTSLFFY
jgi:hypothetical protein